MKLVAMLVECRFGGGQTFGSTWILHLLSELACVCVCAPVSVCVCVLSLNMFGCDVAVC